MPPTDLSNLWETQGTESRIEGMSLVRHQDGRYEVRFSKQQDQSKSKEFTSEQDVLDYIREICESAPTA